MIRLKFPRRLMMLMIGVPAATFTVLPEASWTLTGQAMAAPQTRRPYDKELLRLSEILGAVHYLRELCGAKDEQVWRERMMELIKAEGTSALRRARLTRRFNQGYRSYSRTYNACTPSAKTAIDRFLAEGNGISGGLLKAYP